ncbi:MAG: prephenate dehydrogenase/arogenate dehydrogenase family protein [Opitutae bacterium]|nr:prephenate dehydrogenase/arogenate dehydrogenase family protein [Opitutae bacterium]
MYNSLSIIGPGLLGASIAMSVYEKKLAKEIHLWARSEHKRNLCLKTDWCDHVHETLEHVAKNSDFIIICTPVDTIIPILKTIAPHLTPGTIVTDVGSVKESICSLAKTIPNNNHFHFIGSHPMAGSEKSGMEHASSTLLKEATCIVTPTEQAETSALEKVTQFWDNLEMQPVLMEPQIHDSLIAKISHLPHIVASILAASLSDIPTEQFAYSGGGLKDTTRVAGGSPSLWQSIISQNADPILKSIDQFEHTLKAFKESLASQDLDNLHKILNEGQLTRKAIEKSN